MKKITLLLAALTMLLASCNNTDRQTPATPKALKETPKALEGSEFKSLRTEENLMEKLYEELVEKTPELSQLDKDVSLLNASQSDSLEVFNSYNQKNENYYRGALENIRAMNDTVLRDQMKQLIAANQLAYKTKIKGYTNLIEAIESKNSNLHDLYIVLKLTRTLPLINTYQDNSLPSVKPIQSYSAQQDKAIKKTQELIKK